MALFNYNIERAVLSTLIFEPALFADIADKFSEDIFAHPTHKLIAAAIIELDAKDMPIDEELIRDKIGEKNADALIEILAATPFSFSGLPWHIDKLIQLYKKRALRQLGLKIQHWIEEKEPDDVANAACKTIDDIQSFAETEETCTLLYIQRFVQKMRDAKESGFSGYKSGLASLDALIGGFDPGDLVIVAARPSMGKTSFATTVTSWALERDFGVLFDSLEMPGEKIVQRLIATRSGESLSDLKRGEVRDYEKFKEVLSFFQRAPLYLQDQSYPTISQLKARAVRVLRKNPHIKYYFIDHLRYIKKPGQNIANEVSEITKELKKIAKEFGVVIFLLSQLNREGEKSSDKKPKLSHLRESGAVEEDADVVIGLHRESYYRRSKLQREPAINEAELIVLKNRDGQAGVAKCWFNGPCARFQNYGEVVYESGHDDMNMPIID